MSKYLIVLIWPAGMAAIFGCALLLTRRRAASPDAGPARAAREAGRHHSHKATEGSAIRAAATGTAKLAVLAAAGTVVAFGLMSLLGLGVVYHGLSIDRPVFDWMGGHHVHVMVAAMNRLTKIGDTWTTWGAAVAAAACLAVTWRGQRWLPPAALGTLIVIDHYTTLALRHEFHRLGPPTSPLGTYPSGGCDRCIVFFGLVAYLLWREFSGRRPAAIWAASAVAALGFNEAYSRVYLGLHWFTDALSGLIYGGLLLTAFIVAIRLVADRAPAAQPGRPVPEVPAGVYSTEGSPI